MRARHNPATTTAKSLSTTRAGATASRRTATAAIVSPTPPPAGPLTSRIFVIALDAVGNQIINPTTFDIPIQVQLSLNGMPANSVSLNVAYAG
jgi:hypothetical protein